MTVGILSTGGLGEWAAGAVGATGAEETLDLPDFGFLTGSVAKPMLPTPKQIVRQINERNMIPSMKAVTSDSFHPP